MEIRAESIFRPSEEDVEVVYALSGSDSRTPDKIHSLASSQVVLHSSSTSVSHYIEGILENIISERKDHPKLIVHIHTHPMGIPNLSESDREYIGEFVKIIKRYNSKVNVVFGVHAISSESVREKREPVASNHKLKWSSINREHEIGFYDEEGKQCRVDIIE